MSNTNNYATTASQNELEATKTALETNGFKVMIVDDLAEAKKAVLDLIPLGAEVHTNTSVTLEESGIAPEINESGKYDSVRNKFMPLASQPDKAIEMRRIGSAMDYALGSVHAITQDGRVLIASASGSQLPGYVYGANHVIWVVGAQKIVKDLAEAMDRIETYSLPLEDKRALKAYGGHSSLNKILIYQKETRQRITIVLIKQVVGY